MPHFPDKFMPFMEKPAGAGLSSNAVAFYGRAIKALRTLTQWHANMEPSWRHNKPKLTTGYKPEAGYKPTAGQKPAA
jgi:hydrogenase small subunit